MSTKVPISQVDFKVQHFFYNGFSVKLEDGFADWTARFIKWSGDPGMTVCKTSKGFNKKIPACALHGPRKDDLPEEPDYQAMKDAGTFKWFAKGSSSKEPKPYYW